MSSDAPASPNRPAQYEFTAAQNEVIGGLGRKMKLVGLIILIFGILNLVNAVLFQVAYTQINNEKIPAEVRDELTKLGQRERWLITGYLVLVGAVFCAVGAWTRSAGGSFGEVVETRGRDINHVMDGFTTLNKMYSLIATTLVAAILAYLVLVIVRATQQT